MKTQAVLVVVQLYCSETLMVYFMKHLPMMATGLNSTLKLDSIFSYGTIEAMVDQKVQLAQKIDFQTLINLLITLKM